MKSDEKVIEEFRGILAGAYCTMENAKKIVDVELLDEMEKRAISFILKTRRESVEEFVDSMDVHLDMLPVYLRSTFSKDCGRGETEDEMSTEMWQKEQVKEIINRKKQEFLMEK